MQHENKMRSKRLEEDKSTDGQRLCNFHYELYKGKKIDGNDGLVKQYAGARYGSCTHARYASYTHALTPTLTALVSRFPFCSASGASSSSSSAFPASNPRKSVVRLLCAVLCCVCLLVRGVAL